MDGVLAVALTNAAVAAVLALGAAAAARLVRRPAVVHALWLVVLAKLLTPPIVELGLLPAPAAATPPAGTAPVVQAVDRGVDRRPETAASGVAASSTLAAASAATPRLALRPSIDWRRLGLRVWALGAGALVLLALWHARRLRRWAREARPADAALGRRATELGARLGLRRVPEVRLTERPLPPLVWACLGAPRILLPESLWRRLDARERDAVLAHELAHVRRRDHRVRLLELVAGVLFWWHPAVWWARRGLRRAEERCCDRRVLAVLPGAGRAYARALVKSLELAVHRAPLPALASGIDSYQNIEERLTMILKPRPETPLHPGHRLALLALLVGALAVFPAGSRAAPDDEAETPGAQPRVEEIEIEDMELELEEQALELEARRGALEARRLEIEAEARRAALAARAEDHARRAAALEAEGHAEAAAALRREAAAVERHAELERQHLALHKEHLEGLWPLELELRRAALEAERRAARGDEAAVDELRQRQRQLEERHRARARALAERRSELEKRHRALASENVEERVRDELTRLRSELPRRLQELRAHLETAGKTGELSDRLARLEADLESALAAAVD